MRPVRRSAPRTAPRPAPRRRAAPPAPRPERNEATRLAELEAEAPHAHIVCRVCGRIQGLELSELDRHLLSRLAESRPDGWSVERIAFSVAGACQRCREGPRAP